jgi:hypothetical protein
MPAEIDTWESLGRHFQLASTLYWNCRPSTIPYALKTLDTVIEGIHAFPAQEVQNGNR